MPESLAAKKKRPARQKPPRSLGRIAGEILAGAVAGLAMAFAVAVVTFSAFAGAYRIGSKA